MPPVVGEIIALTARYHRVPVTPALYARCFWELERSGDSKNEIVGAIVRAFNSARTEP